MIHLVNFLDGIQYCVTVVGKLVFDSNIPVVLPLTREKIDYCCTNGDKTKGKNSYKGVLNFVFRQRKISVILRSKNTRILFYVIDIIYKKRIINKLHKSIKIFYIKYIDKLCLRMIISLYTQYNYNQLFIRSY